MKKASVSELKAYASEFLARVKAGEEVLVTERGKPIAKIVPLLRNESDPGATMARLERAGLAKIGKGGLPAGFWDSKRPSDPKGAALSALISERKDGR